MKKYAIMWILLLTLMLGSIHSVIAVQDNGDGGIKPYGVPGFVTTYEVPMEINCTWSHGSPSLQILFWSDSNTLAPLPNSGWGDEILSINVPENGMFVNITVTDAFDKGDYFEVWEVDGVSPTSGHLIGTTPQVPKSNIGTTTLPDIAFADPTYSHGSFRVLLQSGTHYFAFREVGHHWGGGAFYVKFCYTSAPVGGTLMPVDTLVAGTPYFALVGVVGVVLIVAAVKKRRF